MRKNLISRNVFFFIIIFYASNSLFAQSEVEWDYLFNGKNLNGWVKKGGSASYEVEDGVIVGTTAIGTPNSFLCTEKDYGNFILELDFKVDEGLNSGIQIRSQSLNHYRDGIVHGYQVEIDPAQKDLYIKNPPNQKANGEIIPAGIEPRRWTGGIYDEKRRGWLYDLTENEAARLAFKPGEWNHLRVEAIGESIRTWINKIPAANLLDFITPNGFIALQVHATKEEKPMQVRWKNIQIKDLGLNQVYDEKKNIFIGDWESPETDFIAQVFKNADGVYLANLSKEFGEKKEPTVVLTGQLLDNENSSVLKFEGYEWTGVIKKKRFNLEHGDKKFELKKVIRRSSTLNMAAPEDAIVLFDGTNLDAWLSQKTKDWLNSDGPANDWLISPGGSLEVVPESGSLISKKVFNDFKLHFEFRLLGEKTNGGVYLLARYEVNIKDSYGLVGSSPCGALGNIAIPENPEAKFNAAYPPMHWQSCDIDFRAPRFDPVSNKKIENARISVILNGLKLYDNAEPEKLKGAAKRLGEEASGPIMLQEHGTAYQFRNIWIVETKE